MHEVISPLFPHVFVEKHRVANRKLLPLLQQMWDHVNTMRQRHAHIRDNVNTKLMELCLKRMTPRGSEGPPECLYGIPGRDTTCPHAKSPRSSFLGPSSTSPSTSLSLSLSLTLSPPPPAITCAQVHFSVFWRNKSTQEAVWSYVPRGGGGGGGEVCNLSIAA